MSADGDVNIVVAQQLPDTQLLGGVVFHHQQPLAARRGVFLDPGQGRLQALGRRGLGHEGERAARQAVLPVFVQRQHLHRDVPRGRVLLQMAEHGPAQHIGQEHVQRYGRRVVLAGQGERLRAAHGHEDLEPLVAGQITHDAGIVRIVFDDQQDGVVGLQVVAVVRDLLDRALWHAHREERARRWERRYGLTLSVTVTLATDGPT